MIMTALKEIFFGKGAWWATISTPLWRETLGPFNSQQMATQAITNAIALAQSEGAGFLEGN